MSTSHRIGTTGGIELDEGSIVFRHDWTDETELGPSITDAVTILTDEPLERIGTQLRASVDLDGLDRIFEPLADGTPREGSRLVVSLESCVVTVESNGWVLVEHETDDGG